MEVIVSSSGAVALPLPGVTVENNRVYTAFAMGLAGAGVNEPPLQAVFSVDAVPEPAAFGLLAIGIVSLLFVRRQG